MWRGSIYAWELFPWPHYSRVCWLPVLYEIPTLVLSSPRSKEHRSSVTLGDLCICVRVGKGESVWWFVCFYTFFLWELLSVEMVGFNRHRHLCSECSLKDGTPFVREKKQPEDIWTEITHPWWVLLANTLIPINTCVHSSSFLLISFRIPHKAVPKYSAL